MVQRHLPPGTMIRCDAARAPLAERGLSFRQQKEATTVLLGETEIRPAAIWWFQPIPRERDGMVSAAVAPMVDPAEIILGNALCRTMEPPVLELVSDLAHRAVLRHIDALEDAFPGDRYVNLPASIRRAASKPLNLQVAVDCGFSIPERALFAQDPAVARAWVSEMFRRGQRVLWKLAVNAVYRSADGDLHKLPPTEILQKDEVGFPYDMVRHLPLIFESVVPGDRDLRVVVAGREVFAAQIVPLGHGSLDPRAGDHRYERYPVSAAFAHRCRGYVRRLGLRYGVLDFRLRPDGDPVFLEAQGDGTFAEVETHTEQDVSGAVARTLRAVATSRS